MIRYILVALAICIGTGAAFADEAQLSAHHDAYLTARANGDIRAAADHAAAAYDEAIAVHGRGTDEAQPYVAAYVRSLNDLLDYAGAAEILFDFVNAENADPLIFEVRFETGRLMWGLLQYESARETFLSALNAAEETYGVNSLQAARTHLELARAYPDRSTIVSGDNLRNRLIGTGFPYIRGSEDSLNRAEELFAQFPNSNRELEILHITRGAYELADDNRRAAGEYIEPAVDALAALGYMDDYVLTIYVDWVARHLTHWSTNRMERALVRGYDLGSLRAEGEPIPLARTTATHNRRACIDLDRNQTGTALMEYSVNELGQVPRTAAIETNLPDWWVSEQRYQMRQWAFIPAQANGEPIRVDGLRYNVQVARGRSC